MSFFFAGHETTANSLTSIMRRLCENPDVLNKLYQEVKDIPLTWDGIQGCK
jgi:cytochrome P450